MEDFSFEEIRSETELLRSSFWEDASIEPTLEPIIELCFDKDYHKIDCEQPTIHKLKICFDKYDQEIDCKTEEIDIEPKEELGKAEARFYQDCEFSMESPGMIFMYGATLVLVVLAIIGIYIAKRKT